MDTTKCEALLCAVERGSFTAAALQLGYTPSGVTRMVDALEAELGLVIVRRTRAGVSLTPDGKALLPSLQTYVRSGRLLEEQAGGLRGIVTGHIRIGTYYSIAAHWLPQIIAGFKEAHPGVTLSLREAGNRELKQLLKEGRVDCLFTSSRLVQGDWLPLGDDRIVAWVPRQWPQSKLEAMPLETLASLPFIMPLPGDENDIDALFKAHELHPDVRYTVQDSYTAWRMVEAGLGASANNLLMSRGWSGGVEVVPLAPEQQIQLGVEVPDEKAMSPALKAFVSHARAFVDAELRQA